MILDGKKMSAQLIEKMKIEVCNLKDKPKVVDIVIGESDSSNLYIKNKRKACMNVGIDFESVFFGLETSESDLISFIEQLNDDLSVDAIMIQLPIPSKFDTNRIINSINPNKDVDGLTLYNQIKLYSGRYDIIPCTPKGILRILEYYQISLKDKHVVIIGRGSLVGKPLVPLLLNSDANVTVCHSKTSNLSRYIRGADILICGASQANIITDDMVREDCVVIDAGIVYENGRLQGNVCGSVINKARCVTPVPGGVGPVTVMMFLENVLSVTIKIINIMKLEFDWR